MASRLTAEERAEAENAHKAAEELAFTGHTDRRCLRDGGELRVIDYPGGSYQVICEREQRVLATARA